MRNVIYGINLTADGCCDHTKGNANEEVHEYFTDLMHDVDLLVYGRKTYELMVPYWPEVAKNHGNTTIIRGNLGDEILKLKQQPGKKISIGGVDLPSQLIALDLVDEFYFVIHPVLAGKGRRLLEDTSLPDQLNLKLVSSKIFKSGYVALHYLKDWNKE